jgi:hypothetical protein
VNFRPSSAPGETWLDQRDRFAVLALVLLCVATSITYYTWEIWLHRYDTFGYFLPNFHDLGVRLRNFDIPAWNPSYFGGQPFIGDPAIGWMYLPVMFAFTFFGAVAGFKILVLLCSIIGSVAIYLFSRSAGFSPVPALVTAIAFAIGSIVSGFVSAGIAVSMTYPIIAVSLLAADRAIRARSLPAFLSWSALCGVAIVHNFASWPTSGLMYTAIYIAAWVAYRSFIEPDSAVGSRLDHVKRVAAFGIVALVVAVGVGGAVIWPVLDFSNQSLISGADYSGVVALDQAQATPLIQTLSYPFMFHYWYSIWTYGGVVIILAALALVLGWNRRGTLSFAGIAFIMIDLSSTETILRPVFNLIPFFKLIHDHRPATSAHMMYPAVLLLAGAGLQLFLEERRARRVLAGVALGLVAFLALRERASRENFEFNSWATGTVFVISALCVLTVIPLPTSFPMRSVGRRMQVTAALFPILTLLYPIGVNGSWGTALDLVSNDSNGITRAEWAPIPDQSFVDIPWTLDTTFGPTQPGSAAEFLQRQMDNQQPFRYATYYGADAVGYAVESPAYVALLDRSRAAELGLEHISGYNPIGLKYYSEYFDVMDDRKQDYHYRDLYLPAMQSPELLSMLNVRYVIILASLPEAPPIAQYGTEVYRDNFVIVYENPFAYKRAWLVHDVRADSDWNTFLGMIKTSEVDGRNVAFVEGDVPAFEPLPEGAAPDKVVVTKNSAEELKLRATTEAAGMVVVSQTYADGWNAYVDGNQVDIIRTNHTLQGVPVDAGTHEIVLKYEPRSLTIGLWSTGIAGIAVIGIWFWTAIDSRRRKTFTIVRKP